MMDVPKSMRCNTGECERAHAAMERFFQETVDEIVKIFPNKPETRQMHLTIDARELCIPEPTPRATNEAAHMLKYKDRVVAVVLETRTEFNYVQYDFFRNLEGLADGEY